MRRLPPLRRPSAPLLALLLLAGPAAAQRDSEFMTAFRAAMRGGDLETRAQLIREHEEAAILAVAETCELISQSPTDDLEEEIDYLGKAWRSAMDTGYVNQQYEYFSLLKPQFKRARQTLKERFDKKLDEYRRTVEEGELGPLAGLGLEFEGLGDGFHELGDLFQAALCAQYQGECFGEDLRGSDADLARSAAGYAKMIEYREEIGLRGSITARAKEIFEDLEFRGFGDPSKGPEARARERMEEDPSFRPAPMNGTFEVVEDLEAVARPNYSLDPLYQVWQTVDLREEGTRTTFHLLHESPPDVIRTGINEVKLDSDGDGEGDLEIPINGSQTTIRMDVEIGGVKRPWAFMAVTGSDRDTYQGVQPFNLAPSDFGVSIYVAPAASLVGTIAETRIQVFDDNMDGRYGSGPLRWALAGMREGDSHIDVDSILIGDAKAAIPWSELVQIGDLWYRLESNETGSDIVYSRAEVETGTLKLSMKGLDADSLILQGSGNNDGVFIDVASSKRGVEAPVGSYSLLVGRVSKGKRNQMMKAMVLPPENVRTWSVAPGETTTVELGAPFGFDFAFEQDEDLVKVKGSQIVVTGRDGETYQRLWNCRIQPEIVLRKAGTKKGGKGTKMRIAGSQEEVYEDGYQVIWSPYDTQVAKKKSGEEVEVQLFEKKNKLFGKIESDWKGN